MEKPMTAQPGSTLTSAAPDPALRHDAVGMLSTLSLGLASVAPVYSITVTLGYVVMVAGDLAPAALLVGFMPILCTAFAFRELNKRMPDCGTNFVWVTKAFGPWPGLLFGAWVPQIATFLAMSALAQVGAQSLLTLVGLDDMADNSGAVLVVGLGIIATVTAVAYGGIELSGKVQVVMVALQLTALLVFGIGALTHGDASAVSLSSFNPFAFTDLTTFSEAVMLALFIYWGWDAALNVNEEAHDGARTPGRAAVLSTLILLGAYGFTAVAALSFAGLGGVSDPDIAADVLGSLAPEVLSGPLAWFVQLAVVLSAIAALLTCAVSASRPLMSASRHGALPHVFSRVHPVHRTPQFATVFVGASGAVLLVMLTTFSPDFFGDALLSIGMFICVYYSATALACVAYYRRSLLESPQAFLTRGLLPLAGALMMLAALVLNARDVIDPAYGYTSFHGIGGVFLLGVGAIFAGVALVAVLRIRHAAFFRTGRATITDLVVAEDS
jgi:amino acid transporter